MPAICPAQPPVAALPHSTPCPANSLCAVGRSPKGKRAKPPPLDNRYDALEVDFAARLQVAAAKAVAARGRPAGDVWLAIATALQQHGALPLCDIAEHSQVGYAACRHAISNALRAERLEIVGHTKVAHAKQWVALYDLVASTPVVSAPTAAPAAAVLDDAIRRWF